MGKRKERRLAAMSNAGRRVKLDLFAEPSGDLGGSSTREGDGGDLDLKHHAGSPNSPSSSDCSVAVALGTFNGQIRSCPATVKILNDSRPVLPLFRSIRAYGDYDREKFLYRDDEVDVQSNERLDTAAVESSLADYNEQVKGLFAEECKQVDVNADTDLAAQTVERQDEEKDSASQDALPNLDGSDAGDNDNVIVGQLCKDTDSTEQVSVRSTSDFQVTGDVGWKMVLHEESNQYYYWNIETGETSWEVPEILSQATALTNGHKTLSVTQAMETASLGTLDSSSELVEEHVSSAMHINDVSGVANLVPESKGLYECGTLYECNEGYRDENLNGKSRTAEIFKEGITCMSSQKYGVDLLQNGNSIVTETDKYMHERSADGEHVTGANISSGLIEHGECLLERLMSMERPEGHLRGHDWVSKYIMEIEVRLSDIRALMGYGSSLLPFWEYSERRLKQLEAAITDEIIQSAKKVNGVETIDASVTREEDKLMENMRHVNGVDGHFKGVVFSSEHSGAPSSIVTSAIAQTDLCFEAPNNDVVVAEHANSSGHSSAHVDDAAGRNYQTVSVCAGLPAESSSKPTFHAGEDVDMDVDMEVEDANPTNNATIQDTTRAEHFASAQESVQPNAPTGYPLPATEDGLFVPLPPDEEWIPPPPPDNELVPPPPPDEPPEPPCPPPPSYSEPVQAFTYTGPYQLSYPNSNFQFYGQTTEVPSSNIGGRVEGHQVTVPHQPVYYEVVPNTYLESAPGTVNHANSAAYYNIEDGTVPPVPVVSCVESSGFHVESCPVSYSSLPTSQSGSTGAIPGANMKADYSAFGAGTGMESIDVPIASISATTQAVATTSPEETIFVPPTNPVTSATVTDAKIGSKVSRSKKRTVAVAPTLRSNKKVSKLVDKWKAAKEELHEDDEDEPENAYDILEKKRQREIEEWHAQQIASRDARENANFQPLGGDWRERVKRRRAARERLQSPSEVASDVNQQPNLVDLSRDLPPGWQALWDESSKQVYYGNATTSETTWTKPTK